MKSSVFLAVVLLFSASMPVTPSGNSTCEHVIYNDVLQLPAGTVQCWEEAYVEQTYGFVGKSNGVVIASVVRMGEGSPWYGAVVFNCPDGVAEFEAGQVVPIRGTVRGSHTIAGGPPTDGIHLPCLDLLP